MLMVEEPLGARCYAPVVGAVARIEFPLTALVLTVLPCKVQENQWLNGWGALPSKNRLCSRGIVRSAHRLSYSKQSSTPTFSGTVQSPDSPLYLRDAMNSNAALLYVILSRLSREIFALLLNRSAQPLT